MSLTGISMTIIQDIGLKFGTRHIESVGFENRYYVKPLDSNLRPGRWKDTEPSSRFQFMFTVVDLSGTLTSVKSLFTHVKP